MKFNVSKKMDAEMSKYRRYCKCGHSVIFPIGSKGTKTICTWCGTIIYKTDLEEFKDKYKKKKKEIEK